MLGYGVKTGTQEIDFSSRPSPIHIPMGSAVGGIQTDKATIGGNLPRNQMHYLTNSQFLMRKGTH